MWRDAGRNDGQKGQPGTAAVPFFTFRGSGGNHILQCHGRGGKVCARKHGRESGFRVHGAEAGFLPVVWHGTQGTALVVISWIFVCADGHIGTFIFMYGGLFWIFGFRSGLCHDDEYRAGSHFPVWSSCLSPMCLLCARYVSSCDLDAGAGTGIKVETGLFPPGTYGIGSGCRKLFESVGAGSFIKNFMFITTSCPICKSGGKMLLFLC